MGTDGGPFTVDAELPRSPSRRARGSTRHDVEHVSTNCRALVIREDRRDTISSTLSMNCRALVVREGRRDTILSTLSMNRCALVVREDRRDTISSSLSMNCRTLVVGEDRRDTISSRNLDEPSCTRRPRGSTRHWRATCQTGSARHLRYVVNLEYERRDRRVVAVGVNNENTRSSTLIDELAVLSSSERIDEHDLDALSGAHRPRGSITCSTS